MIVETEAVVLQARKYNETSKIAVLYSKEFGKISIIAKGAFNTKTGVGGMLEPLSYISISFYKKANSDLHLLKSIETVTHLNKILNNYETLILGLIASEFISYSQVENHANPVIFYDLANFLISLNDSENDKHVLTIVFLFKLLKSIGYLLNFSSVEKLLNTNNNRIKISLKDGSILLKTIDINSDNSNLKNNLMTYIFELTTLRKINDYSKMKFEEISIDSELSITEFLEVIDFFCKFLEYHLDKKIIIKSLSLVL